MIAKFPRLPAEIDGSQMQDAVPTLAVLAAFNETPVHFVGIANLRVKECDRIRALSTGLTQIRRIWHARKATISSSSLIRRLPEGVFLPRSSLSPTTASP